ncbi:BCCT family transporter [Gymnodinialimonas ceratoperidinii]|uniref:BCCT family transporter n=1 Tax=Gymnodinialimonas ceratoperidinii TaxID=2856823 RepID=A0A8F6YAF3_9RHOB|nr:BCCT family transporter [Gymnodinialimonas ceratoperidinii]QXT38931.1 BCCT family transporter [Gymnodinialimonas ceratoperidinii]
MRPPVTELDIPTADEGFYKGFTKIVAISGKFLVAVLIIWALLPAASLTFGPAAEGPASVFVDADGNYSAAASVVLGAVNSVILASFNYWYVYVMAFFVILCLVLALWPASGQLKLGLEDDEPEFTNFSWFSMMFGAGIGIGMLTFATAEPMYHWASNPATIQGINEGSTAGNVREAYVWSFTHWGLAAWSSYAIVGLALAYFSYRRSLPLTIRSALVPLFGRSAMEGFFGHVVDIVAVVATVLGVSQTLGFGVEQFISGLTRIGFGDWLQQTGADGTVRASAAGIVVALIVIMGASTLSALSGVGKGIKWLSNINMGLSFFILAFFLIFGSTFFGLQALFVGIFDYLVSIPGNILTVWASDGVEGSEASQLAGWQGGWTIFYWAWWIAFAPFVGVFLARISKGRTVREYVLGAMIVPATMCFVWFAIVGGTAIDLELNGDAAGAIVNTGQSDQLFAMLAVMLSDSLAWIMSVIVVILLLTYLVTSADSAVLIINTINAAGDEGPKARPHIVFWGAALALVVGGLIVAGGLGAIQTAMVIGALPFSLVMVLMGFSLLKAVVNDGRRSRRGLASTHDEIAAE